LIRLDANGKILMFLLSTCLPRPIAPIFYLDVKNPHIMRNILMDKALARFLPDDDLIRQSACRQNLIFCLLPTFGVIHESSLANFSFRKPLLRERSQSSCVCVFVSVILSSTGSWGVRYWLAALSNLWIPSAVSRDGSSACPD
jgi:hypothetical protein